MIFFCCFSRANLCLHLGLYIFIHYGLSHTKNHINFRSDRLKKLWLGRKLEIWAVILIGYFWDFFKSMEIVQKMKKKLLHKNWKKNFCNQQCSQIKSWDKAVFFLKTENWKFSKVWKQSWKKLAIDFFAMIYLLVSFQRCNTKMSHTFIDFLAIQFLLKNVWPTTFKMFYLHFQSNFQVTLTLWQTALLANAFLLYSFPNLWWGHLVSQGTYVYLYPYVYTFANTTHTGSVWIVLTLTIDRYLALCQPLKHRAIGKKRCVKWSYLLGKPKSIYLISLFFRRVRRLMIVVSAMAVMFSIPRFFEVHVILICDEDQLSCVATIDRTELFDVSRK